MMPHYEVAVMRLRKLHQESIRFVPISVLVLAFESPPYIIGIWGQQLGQAVSKTVGEE